MEVWFLIRRLFFILMPLYSVGSFPFHYKENPKYQSVVEVDIRHYQYGNDYNESGRYGLFSVFNRRTTSVFSQFANEDNLAGILALNWYDIGIWS